MNRAERREQIEALLAEDIADSLGENHDPTDLVAHWVALVGVSSTNDDGGFGWVGSVTSDPTPPTYVQRGLAIAWLDHHRAIEVAHHVHARDDE